MISQTERKSSNTTPTKKPELPAKPTTMHSSNASKKPWKFSQTPNVAVSLTLLILTTKPSKKTFPPKSRSKLKKILTRTFSRSLELYSNVRRGSARRSLCHSLESTTIARSRLRASMTFGTTLIVGGASNIWIRRSTRVAIGASFISTNLSLKIDTYTYMSYVI